MDFFTQLNIGFTTYKDAHRFIKKHKLWHYVAIPGIINLLLIFVVLYFASKTSDIFLSYIQPDIDCDSGFFLFNWICELVQWSFGSFIFIISTILLYFIYAIIYKNLVLVIMSPVLALISEKVEEIQTGNKYPFNVSQFLKDIVRGIRIAIRNLVKEILYTLLIYILCFIPIVGIISPVLIFLIQSYYFGFSMLDYSSERRRFTVKESKKFIWNHKAIAIGNGIIFYAMFLVPFIGWMFAPAYGIIAATFAFQKIINDNLPAKQ